MILGQACGLAPSNMKAVSTAQPESSIGVWCIRLRYLWLLATIGQMTFIYWTSDRSWEGTGEELHPGIANFVHFVLYGGIAGFAYLACSGFWPGRVPKVLWIWLGTAGFGLFDEFHQAFVPGRDFSLWDVVTDGAGAMFATTALDAVFRTEREHLIRILLISLGLGLASSFIFPAIIPNL
ncbi:MAG: VanZ family protein [Planctomycetota bacterium]|jgi:VanZ family protein